MSAHLGLEIILGNNLVHESQLSFKPIHVLLPGLQDILQQIAADVVDNGFTIDTVLQTGPGLGIQLDIVLRRFSHVFADQQLVQILQGWQPFQE